MSEDGRENARPRFDGQCVQFHIGQIADQNKSSSSISRNAR